MKDTQKKKITQNYHLLRRVEMLSRDSVHLPKLERNPNKCVKYK